MVPESRHLSFYACVNDQATVTMAVFFSGDEPACHTHANLVPQTRQHAMFRQSEIKRVERVSRSIFAGTSKLVDSVVGCLTGSRCGPACFILTFVSSTSFTRL